MQGILIEAQNLETSDLVFTAELCNQRCDAAVWGLGGSTVAFQVRHTHGPLKS